MMQLSPKSCLMAGALLASTSVCLAQTFPGNVPDGLAGDWDCDGTRAFITGLGSIEIISDTYLAGLFDANDGVIEIEWDDGTRATWRYDFSSPEVLSLSVDDGSKWDCTPRE